MQWARVYTLAMLGCWLAARANCAADELPNVLDVPAILEQQAADNLRAVTLLRRGEHASALAILKQCLTRMPFDLMATYNLACAHALLKQPDEAVADLKSAIKLGFRNKQQLQQDEDLASLRDRPDFADILKQCDTPAPKEAPGWHYNVQIAEPRGSAITIDHQNMTWNSTARVMQVYVDASRSGQDRLSAGLTGKLGDKIMKWYGEGTAAGNVGDLYDNHDRAHSKLDPARYPQLTRLIFGPEIQKRQLDNGPQKLFVFLNAKLKASDDKKNEETQAVKPKVVSTTQLDISRTIVMGNSSTAATGSAMWRSIPRLMLTSTGGAEALMQQYTNNHLYIYPEHQDHDAGYADGTGWGDVYFANTPFYLISQGSSYTDQPFMDAIAATLSAFQPETKNVLRERGLVAPTLQMIFRRCNQQVTSDKEYLSGIAHPTVFEGNQIDADRMVEMAHAMKPDEIPPVAMIQVLKESPFSPTIDYFDAGASEPVLTTPFAVARVCQSTSFWREMIVSTVGSIDINHRPLEFHWVVLRGDPELVKIGDVPGNSNARHIRIGYHPRRPIQPGSAIESNRVDIGVFAHNGVHFSAPAILSFMFSDAEVRVYDNQQRIQSVDYRNPKNVYIDPILIPQRMWKDEYHYDEKGELTGWTRLRGDKREEFNTSGELVENGQSRRVSYQRINNPDGRQALVQKIEED